MGKIILCKGRYADTPYCFRLTGTKVYSIEEICCYLASHIWLINDETFDMDLVRWIDGNLKLPLLADKIETLIRRNAGKKDIAAALLCGCDYFSDNEIRELLSDMKKSDGMDETGKNKMKADILFERNEIRKAGEIYREVFSEISEKNVSTAVRADILKKLGFTELYSGSGIKAAGYYKEAYKLLRDIESLTGYLLSVRFSGKKGENIDEFESLKVSSSEMEEYKNVISAVEAEAAKINERDFSSSLKKAYSSNRINEYYSRRRSYMEKIKKEYRDMLVY